MLMKRLLLSSIAALGLVACGEPASNGPDADYQPGVQLYTVRDKLGVDYEGTLQRISDVGYGEVELAGFYGREPREVAALLTGMGLNPVASHVNWATFKSDPASLIAETKAVGADYIILAWMPEEERQTLDQWRDWARRMNEVGAMAKEAGLIFAFHNHDFEFLPIDGVEPYDVLLSETDPDLVKLELDVYWAARVGKDPVKIMESNANRIELLHIKDMRKADKAMVDVGSGDLDFEAILKTGRDIGVKHYFVEHDNPDDSLQSVASAYQHLSNLDY